MAFRIIADSSCDIFDLENKPDNLYFNTVPFVVTVDGKDFVDDENTKYDRVYSLPEGTKTDRHSIVMLTEALTGFR